MTTGYYYDANNQRQGTYSNTTYDIDVGTLRHWSSSADLFSVKHAQGQLPNASWNLTYKPVGPNLFHGGFGIWFWATDLTVEIGSPQMWVTGTLTVNGTEVGVIPEKSLA
ncbi:hypothetical protein ACJQWK_02548 [Exserohilum turcicum]